jgi:iron complex outermembrane recepter protein
VTAAEAERRVRAEYAGRLEGSASYRSYFPGLHLKYEARSGLVFRLSHSNGIGRPDFGSIMPNSTVNFSSQTITLSNPALKPQYSKNYDASVEYYFEPVGLVSVGVFSKDVRDFIFQDRSRFVGAGANNGFDGEYEGYNIITSANGGSARYRGVEVSFQQQFTFLRGLWSRFGLNANYTYLTTEGNYGGAAVSTQVAGFKPRTANLGISYRGTKASVIVQGNWVGTWLTSNSTNAALLRYEKPRTQIDVKTKYTISRRLGLFCDIENLLAEPLNQNYLTYEDRAGQTRLTAPKIVAGVQGRF